MGTQLDFQIRPAVAQDAKRMSELTLAAIKAFAVSPDLSGTEHFVSYAQESSYQERLAQENFFYLSAVTGARMIAMIGVVNQLRTFCITPAKAEVD